MSCHPENDTLEQCSGVRRCVFAAGLCSWHSKAHLIAEAALYLLALDEGLHIRSEFSDNFKGGQVQRHLGASLARQLHRPLQQILPALAHAPLRLLCCTPLVDLTDDLEGFRSTASIMHTSRLNSKYRNPFCNRHMSIFLP